MAVPSHSPLESGTGSAAIDSAVVRPDTANQILTSESSSEVMPQEAPVIGPSGSGDDLRTNGDSVIDITESTALEEYIVDPTIRVNNVGTPKMTQ